MKSPADPTLALIVTRIHRDALEILHAHCPRTPSGRHRGIGEKLSEILYQYDTMKKRQAKRMKLRKEL